MEGILKNTIIEDVHQAMVAAIGFHTNQPEHMLLANKKWNEQMRVAARAAVQEVTEQIGRKAKELGPYDGEHVSRVGQDLTYACLMEPK